MKKSVSGFTIIELIIVIIVISILATLATLSYRGVQAKARDAARIDKASQIAEAIELYKVHNNRYPPIQDGASQETPCGSQTENWGHCDRNKELADYIAPYMTLDPASLSDATQGAYMYYYTSSPADDYQTYGLMVYLEGSDGNGDGGYYTNAREYGELPRYCMNKYTGWNGSWSWSWGGGATPLCQGGN